MPNPRKKLTGRRFGKLVVQRVAKPDKSGNTQWWCLCDCGTEKKVRYNHLSTGATQSCGCAPRKPGRSLDAMAETSFWD